MSKFFPLRDAIKSSGWQINLVEPKSEDWWAWQIWRLESVWSPVGFTLFATFQLDPESEFYPNGKYGRKTVNEVDVYGIDVSWQLLECRTQPAIENFNLRPWQECIDGIVGLVGRLRADSGHQANDLRQKQ